MSQKYPLSIFKNFDNFPPGAFYSHLPTIRHERVSISGHLKRFQLNDLLSQLTKLANIF